MNDLFREHLAIDTTPPVKTADEPLTLTKWQVDFLARMEPLKPMVDWMIAQGLVTPPLPKEPRARALAAKQRQGKGPPSSASWRGRERSTKFRSQ